MPNARRPGWRTSTYTAPATLITAAQARAAETGTTVSAVIRHALDRFIKENP